MPYNSKTDTLNIMLRGFVSKTIDKNTKAPHK